MKNYYFYIVVAVYLNSEDNEIYKKILFNDGENLEIPLFF